MEMKMTTKEKDILFAQIINEHFLTQKNNTVYIPARHLEAKGFDISDSNNALWRLKDNGIIKQYKHCWGFWEIKGSKKVFVITSEEEPKTDDDVEVYQINVIPGHLVQATKSQIEKQEEKNVTLYLNKNGDLYREPKSNFCYPMSGKGVPLKILKYFVDNPNIDYEQNTINAADSIGIKADQLRKEINKMRKPIKDRLKLNSGLIEARRNSGYRLNPNIEIIHKN
ncbi:MAG: hypothetical protein PHC85_01065 [Candidatus Pacebacteria bacterium]|nr:hypothetical protein [Candidatus Paceibacterota bacterium]